MNPRPFGLTKFYEPNALQQNHHTQAALTKNIFLATIIIFVELVFRLCCRMFEANWPICLHSSWGPKWSSIYAWSFTTTKTGKTERKIYFERDIIRSDDSYLYSNKHEKTVKQTFLTLNTHVKELTAYNLLRNKVN